MNAERLFIGVFPCGISYADRHIKVNGDYKPVAFLPYTTLKGEIYKDCPKELVKEILHDMLGVQVKRGQWFQTSASGQGVMLGGNT